MKKNFHRFHEILFIDNSIKHKTPGMCFQSPEDAKTVPLGHSPDEMNLILLSGINNEGKNVLFGFAITRLMDYKSLKWVLRQFIEFSVHHKIGKVYPTTIITQFDPNLNDAVEKVFTGNSTWLLCQSSILKVMKLKFS
jgi:hypothetical protein